MTTSATHRTIDAVWRIESPRLIAGLARIVRDVGLAEDLAQDALVAALERWPESGIPDNPGAWLMATARPRAGRAPDVGAGGHLPRLQRGLHGDGRRRLAAAGAVRGRAASGACPGRTDAAGAGGTRPGRPDGGPGVAITGARRPVGRAD